MDVYLGLGYNLLANKEKFHNLFMHCKKIYWEAVLNTIKYGSNLIGTKSCLAYLFEYCYDLILSVASNVSQNSGFQSFTG